MLISRTSVQCLTTGTATNNTKHSPTVIEMVHMKKKRKEEKDELNKKTKTKTKKKAWGGLEPVPQTTVAF